MDTCGYYSHADLDFFDKEIYLYTEARNKLQSLARERHAEIQKARAA